MNMTDYLLHQCMHDEYFNQSPETNEDLMVELNEDFLFSMLNITEEEWLEIIKDGILIY